jgi:hypothetical protein
MNQIRKLQLGEIVMELNLRAQSDRGGILAMCLTAFTACGTNSSSKNSSEPAPVVDTTVVSQNQTGSSVILAFGSNVANSTFLCKVDVIGADQRRSDGQWSTCAASGLSVPLPAGTSVTVTVKAVSPDGREDLSPLTLPNFQGTAVIVTPDQTGNAPVDQTISSNKRIGDAVPPPPSDNGNGNSGQPSLNILPLDSFNLSTSWTFRVPNNMHILQYAGNYGLGAGIDVLQIMQGQDPNYLSFYPGTFLSSTGCGAYASQPVGIRSLAGNILGYCMGKVHGPEDLADLFGFHYAPNHIEVGSDAGAPVATRMVLQVYDNFQPGMSILSALCDHESNVANFQTEFEAVPMMNSFWAYNYIRSDVRTCRTVRGGINSGRWQVAGFVLHENVLSGSICQSGCRPLSTRALEVVYLVNNPNGMTRDADYFVRDFQALIFNVLSPENGYTPF